MEINLAEVAQGQSIEQVLLYKNVQLKAARNGSHFLQLKLSDASAELDAKKWDTDPMEVERLGSEGFAKVAAQVDSYNGKMQLVVRSIEVVDATHINPRDYLPKAPIDIERAVAEMRAIFESFQEGPLRQLALSFMEDEQFMALLRLAPAAKMLHNAYLGGLLEHLLKVMKEVGHYTKLNPRLNRDLAIMGAFLHDIGKVRELGHTMGFDYTDEGLLIGHLAIGVELLQEKITLIEDFPPECALMLKHFILSHHGTHEWGSPVIPAFPEAVVVHAIDNLNAKLDASFKALDDDNSGGLWTEKVWALGTKLYKGSKVV